MKDLTGLKQGKLKILERVKQKGEPEKYVCLCDCGKEIIILGKYLKGKRGTQSCGCLQKEAILKKCSTHGQSHTLLYKRWSHLKGRCNSSSGRNRYYNGRGIILCEKWQSFDNFRIWAESTGFAPELSLDRIDNNGPYSPENCRWVTRKQQGVNTSKNIFMTYQGKTQTVGQWAEELGMNKGIIRQRIRAGMSEDKIFFPGSLRKLTGKIPKYNYDSDEYRLSSVWRGMKSRCMNPRDPSFHNYGGRGIKVCDDWFNRDTFVKWGLSSNYKKGLTLDRIDNNGDYAPENCRWISISVQNKNKRNNRNLKYEGELLCVSEIARRLKISPSTFQDRIEMKMPENLLFHIGSLTGEIKI